MDYIENCKEVKSGLLTTKKIFEMIKNQDCISYIAHGTHPLLLGPKLLLKVNTNIGVSDATSIETELTKLRLISQLKYAPDTMMDHTYVPVKKPLWKTMVEEFNGPVGTLPHYSTYSENVGIDKNELLEKIEEMAIGGVSFMTLHPTASVSLFEKAKLKRQVPTTSRGGAVILKDAMLNNRMDNIFVDNFEEILKLFKKYNLTLSIGTTFRPVCIGEALDEVQVSEILAQKKYIDAAKSFGVNVMMEGIGHISLDMIPEYCKLIEGHNTPLMPLGPMPTDATVGFDHVTAAIGATAVALLGNVGMINSVTREEHTGGVPTNDAIIEGLKSARVAAHCVNLTRFEKYREFDNTLSKNRAENRSCVIKGGIFMDDSIVENGEGCTRCRYECPLTLLK